MPFLTKNACRNLLLFCFLFSGCLALAETTPTVLPHSETDFLFYKSTSSKATSPPLHEIQRLKDLKTLQSILKSPYYPWRLCHAKEGIFSCSLWKRWYYWNLAFFNEQHQKKLTAILANTYKRYLVRKFFLTDEEQKALEKFTSLLQNPKENFWFTKFFPKHLIPKTPKWNIVKQHNDHPNLLHPTIKNGKFFSEPDGKLYSYQLKDGYQFFKGLVLPSNGVNLKKVMYAPSSPPARSDALKIHWIGHNSFLVQIDGLNILLDPVYHSFYPIWRGFFTLFKRHIPAGIAFDDLPKIDAIIISHADFDHMEEKTLLALKKHQPLMIVPVGLKKWFLNRDFPEGRIVELTWWEKADIFSDNKKLAISAVPALHSSMAREELEANEALWNGYMIDGYNRNIYFPGDTAYSPTLLKQIKQVHDPIDIALLPIAPSDDPRIHMTTEQAAKAMDILQARVMIPSHWGAYRTGNERIEEPYLQLKQLIYDHPQYRRKIIPLEVGGTYP